MDYFSVFFCESLVDSGWIRKFLWSINFCFFWRFIVRQNKTLFLPSQKRLNNLIREAIMGVNNKDESGEKTVKFKKARL